MSVTYRGSSDSPGAIDDFAGPLTPLQKLMRPGCDDDEKGKMTALPCDFLSHKPLTLCEEKEKWKKSVKKKVKSGGRQVVM